jgi:hypothetical protein
MYSGGWGDVYPVVFLKELVVHINMAIIQARSTARVFPVLDVSEKESIARGGDE